MQTFKEDLLKMIGEQLINNKETIAVAESVTSGLLQFAFSNIPDASSFFQGGLTAYNLAQKFKHLGVEPQAAIRCNCVSQEVADTMALQVARLYVSHWSIAITGYATPVPESGHQLFAYYAIAHKKQVVENGRLTASSAEPSSVQHDYVDQLLQKLDKQLQKG